MTSKVVDLTSRIALHESVRPFLTMLETGPAIGKALAVILPKLPKDQQRALQTVVAFRFMGSKLPADFTLLEHLPSLAGMHEQTIAAAFQMLVDAGILGLHEPDPKAKTGAGMAFYWPELERLYAVLDPTTQPDPPADPTPR